MGPKSYMWSIGDCNVVMRHMTVFNWHIYLCCTYVLIYLMMVCNKGQNMWHY